MTPRPQSAPLDRRNRPIRPSSPAPVPPAPDPRRDSQGAGFAAGVDLGATLAILAVRRFGVERAAEALADPATLLRLAHDLGR